MIKILVDSTCDLPEEVLEKYDIGVLSLRVRIKDKDYADKKEIQIEQTTEYMKEGIIPQTSQPALQDVIDIFEQYGESGEDAIYLAFSSKLSGTYQTTYTLLDELRERYPERKFTVVDSKAGSIAIGLMAIEAGEMIAKGYVYEEVVRRMEFLANHVEHVFTLTDLAWLVKGGRISKTQGIVGNVLNIKPIIDIQDGEMQVIHKIRGQKKTLQQIIDIVEERRKNYPEQTIGIAYAGDKAFAETIKTMLEERLGQVDIMITTIGSVLGTHLGLGGVGICFFNAKV
ncbi:MAG: DegV family protein [Cellulosilyticaceae bacterium]